jgi:hypothetical protein
MATKALTAVAPRASHNPVSARKVSAHGRDWREILIKQDAQVIWRELSRLVRSAIQEHHNDYDSLTQELFLFLISTDRLNMYVEQDFSDEEIKLDITTLLTS